MDLKVAGDRETFTATVSYDTLDLYGKFEGSWKIVVEGRKEGTPEVKPAAVQLPPPASVLRF